MSKREAVASKTHSSDDEMSKSTRPLMDSVLKDYLVKRMKEIEAESKLTCGNTSVERGPISENTYCRSRVEVKKAGSVDLDEVDMPSSLSSSDDEMHDEDRKKCEERKLKRLKKDVDESYEEGYKFDSKRSRGEYSRDVSHDGIRVTIHRRDAAEWRNDSNYLTDYKSNAWNESSRREASGRVRSTDRSPRSTRSRLSSSRDRFRSRSRGRSRERSFQCDISSDDPESPVRSSKNHSEKSGHSHRKSTKRRDSSRSERKSRHSNKSKKKKKKKRKSKGDHKKHHKSDAKESSVSDGGLTDNSDECIAKGEGNETGDGVDVDSREVVSDEIGEIQDDDGSEQEIQDDDGSEQEIQDDMEEENLRDVADNEMDNDAESDHEVETVVHDEVQISGNIIHKNQVQKMETVEPIKDEIQMVNVSKSSLLTNQPSSSKINVSKPVNSPDRESSVPEVCDPSLNDVSQLEYADVVKDNPETRTSDRTFVVPTADPLSSDADETPIAATVEAIVAVSKACRNIKLAGSKRPLKPDEVFERVAIDSKEVATAYCAPKAKGAKLASSGIKLSEASSAFIISGLGYDNKRNALLEEGEVPDSGGDEGKDAKSSSDIDMEDIGSTGSLKDDNERTRSKHKKKKKEKKKKNSRKESSRRRRSRSVSKQRSPSRSSSRSKRERSSKGNERKRRSKSPATSGKRRSRSPIRWRSSPRRSRSPSPRSRRRSRSPRRTRRSSRSRSPAYYQWERRAQITKAYRDRAEHRSSDHRRDRSPSLQIDKAKLREIAIQNTLKNIKAGFVNVKADELARIRSGGGQSVKQFTDFCKRMARKTDESGDDDDEPTQKPVDSSDEEPGEIRNDTPIVININNARQLPALSASARAAQQAVLSKQFPVSSGNRHRVHEHEWVPVEPKPVAPVRPKLSPPVPSVPSVPPVPQITAPKAVTAPEISNTDNVSTLSGIAFSSTEHKTQTKTLFDTAIEIAAAAQPVPVPTPAPAFIPSPTPLPGVVPAQERIFPVYTNAPCNIGEVVSQRLAAIKKLSQNPHDVEAMGTMYEANKRMQEWAESRVVPGQFLGSTDAKVLSKEELLGPNKKFQAWAKKGQFAAAEPVKGLGRFLLEKMGWKQGEGLGKNNEGPVQPLLLDVKNDRKGLQSSGEILCQPLVSVPRGRPNAPVRDLSGKHPVSALMELCSKRRWPAPNFIEVIDTGPPHQKKFLFKVVVNNVEYQPILSSPNKKTAKAEAATVCLQNMGLLPR